MKTYKLILWRIIVLTLFFVSSCQDLTEVNINPNGVDPVVAHPNLIMPTVIIATAKNYTASGFGHIAGVMQHTQKDSWSSGHNDYAWDENSWSGYYNILRDNKLMLDKAVDLGLKFHEGVALVMKSFVFGQITDFWGDAPYTEALKSADGNFKPKFDPQKVIYEGILADLEEANAIFSGSDFEEVNPAADVLFSGDVKMWQKFTNSLRLRYFMRVSGTDLATFAEAGIKEVAALPIITSSNEDATIDYLGTSEDNAWPSSIEFGDNSTFLRFNICSTLSEKLVDLNDPRIEVFASKVETPIVVSDVHSADGDDVVIGGIRYITNAAFAARSYKLKVNGVNPSAADLDNFTIIDTNTSGYVGLPPSMGSEPNWYNLNPSPVQGGNNIHVSKLNTMYSHSSGDLLKMRLISAAEVHFILAEAANKGWLTDQQSHYEAGVEASFETWGADIAGYLAGAAAYNGTLEQILEQKWIASWTAANESWADWRRTGLPVLKAGARARRSNLPLRLYYGQDEMNLNTENYLIALNSLVPTPDNGEDNNDSAWSRMWLLQ